MPALPIKPYWSAPNDLLRLYLGDVIDVLRRLPADSVHCVVTSPPYWALRDYRVEGQIGSEKTPQEFVAKMVQVFREVRRVLHPSGTLWLNLGDTYGPKYDYKVPGLVGIPWRVALALKDDGWYFGQDIIWAKPSPMPESVRNRCTKAHEPIFLMSKNKGYYFDQDAIREKTGNESSWDEYNKLLQESWASGRLDTGAGGKKPREKIGFTHPNGSNKRSVWSVEDAQEILGWLAEKFPKVYRQFCDQNRLDVWRIASEGYPGAHFATFPRKLVRPCILAGTSEYGCCPRCLAPWRRVTERRGVKRYRPNDYVKRKGAKGTGNTINQTVAGVEVITKGWEPTCECNGKLVKVRGIRKGYGSYHDHNLDGAAYGLRQQGKGPASKPGVPNKNIPAVWTEYHSELPLEEHPIIPCTVLDPFVGSGTTLEVAFELGRRGWGIDLSEEYLVNNAIPRLTGVLMERPALASQVAPPPKATEGGTDARVYD